MHGGAVVPRLPLALALLWLAASAPPAAAQDSWAARFLEFRESVTGSWVATTPTATYPAKGGATGSLLLEASAEASASGSYQMTYSPPLSLRVSTDDLTYRNTSGEDETVALRITLLDFYSGGATPCEQVQTKAVPNGASATFALEVSCTFSTLRANDVYGTRRAGITASVDLRRVGGLSRFSTSLTAWYEHTAALVMTPSVSPNTVTTQEPLRSRITGGTFASGTTVKIGTGDVKVISATVSAGTAIDVVLGGYSNLPEGPRDVELTRPDGTKQTTKDLFFVTSLVVEPLEVNQGVKMSCSQAEPCVGNHDTVVRAKVSCRGSGCATGKSSSHGRLFVTRNGSPYMASPYPATPATMAVQATATTPISQAEQLRRYKAQDALNFQFQLPALPEGTYQLAFEMDPRRLAQPLAQAGAPDEKRNLVTKLGPLTFTKSVTTSARRIAVFLEGGGKDGWQRVLSAFRYVRSAYPADRDRIQAVPTSSALTFLSAGQVGTETGSILQTFVKQRQLRFWINLFSTRVDGSFFFTDSSWMASRGTTNADGNGTTWTVSSPDSIVSLRDFDMVPKTIAHELGHQMGLGDTYVDTPPNYSPVNSPVGVAACSGGSGCVVEDGGFHFDTGTVAVSPPPGGTVFSTQMLDFMGNAMRGSSWIDRRTWGYLYRKLHLGTSGAPVTAPSPSATEWLRVSGTVEKSGAASFATATRYSGASLDEDTREGEYALELQGASGQVLGSSKLVPVFRVVHAPESDLGVFARSVPWAAGAARLVLKKGSQVLTSRAVSARPPVVAVTYPRGGETLSGTVTATWTASDPDGDALTHDVFVSTDGTTFVPLALGVTGTSRSFDVSLLPKTAKGKVRVVTSDGVNQASADSGGFFSIGAQAPLLSITEPRDGAVFAPGETVVLEAYGWDPTDGELPPGSFRFSSSKDGSLGTGSPLPATLSTGNHVLTVTATNASGVSSTASVAVSVFTPPATPSATVVAPIVLTAGGLSGSHFTSELTLTNRGTATAVARMDYTAAFPAGAGTGTVYESLPPGRQVILPDAVEYLTQAGLPIPTTGNRGGTLRIRFYGLSSPTAGAATIRTTTPVPEGRAGLSYPAIPPAVLSGAVYLCGLRQGGSDRSNVALVNAGSETDGRIVLRPTVYSGNPAAPVTKVLPDMGLDPGGWTQVDQILVSNGLSLTAGYVKVERVLGTAPFYAYAVVNDMANSDGSFVPPVVASSLSGKKGISLPVAVETSSYSTEVVVTNFGAAARTVKLSYVASAVTAAGNETSITLTLAAGEQKVLPAFVQALRDAKAPGIGPAGTTYAGAVFLTVPGGDVSGLSIGGRTSAPGGGGRYGLYYTGVPAGSAATDSAWLYGLQQDEENRTNLAVVNTGETDASPSAFRVEIWDGETGGFVTSVGGISVPPKGWTQMDAVLKNHAPGVRNAYAKVTRTAGTNPFLCYAVVNDGGVPKQRSDDGAFVAMDLSDQAAQAPSLEVTPASLSFGSVAVGQTKSLTVTVKNKGTGTLTGTATAAAPFSVTSGGSFSLAANQTQAVTVRYAPTAAGASSGSLTLASNGGNASVALSGTGTSASTVTQELATDDGTVETGVLQSGLFIVNRLTPSGYPATLKTVRIYVVPFTGQPNPSLAQVRLLAFTDPWNGGRPPASPPVLLDQVLSLPTIPAGGRWVDFDFPTLPSSTAGDFYVGFQANVPSGLGFAADTNGTPRQRGFYSTDGGLTWLGPLVLVDSQGHQSPANILIRALATVPGP